MDSRTSMSSDVPSELSAQPGTTLDVLSQAASRAMQAAYRYRASTTLPFTQHDFEAEHPEWSLSAHRTSSANTSRPASANGPVALHSRSSTASASIHDLASANGRAASPTIGFPSNPVQVIPGAQSKPRKLYPKEQRFPEPHEKQACNGNELGHLGNVDGRATKQYHRDQPALRRDAAQHPSPPFRSSSTMSNRNSHAGRHSNLSISSDATDSEMTMQKRLREISSVPSPAQSLSRDGMPGDVVESYAQDEDAWSIYREVVEPIIQSLNSYYEDLYPQLDVSAIRQEVLDEITETLPDILSERQHPKKRRTKLVRRFAKELWGQKILQHVSRQSSSRRSSSSHAPDVSSLRPGASSVRSSWGKSKSSEQRHNSISQLESIGLSPEPEDKPSESAGFQLQGGLTDVADQEIANTHNHRKALHNNSENHALTAEPTLKSPPGKSGVFSQRSSRKPIGPFSSNSQLKSSKNFPPIPRDWSTVKQKKSRAGYPETINTEQDPVSKVTSGFNLPEISNSQSPENLLDTGHEHRITMTEANPIVIDSDHDEAPLSLTPPRPPAPPRARIIRRGTSGFRPASSRPASSTNTLLPATQGPPPLISTSPPSHSVLPSKSFKGRDYLNDDPALEQTLAALNVLDEKAPRPYRAGDKLEVKDEDTPGAVKHVDFADTELGELLTIIYHLQGSHQDSSANLKDQFKKAVSSLSSSDIAEVARLASKTSGLVSFREQKSIRRFLRRLQRGDGPIVPSIVRVETFKSGPSTGMTTQTLLRRRANGLGRDEFSIQRQLREAMIETFTPQRSWKGASGDIVSIAWNPNSQTYAIGATAPSNAEDLQYNRPNNLLYGDVNHNTLHELPDHYIDRPRPETIASGPNSSEAVYAACDPKVYKTVSAIQYSPDGARMFTASHDETVKIWDVPVDGLPSCSSTLAHDATLSQLATSTRLPNIFATGSPTTAKAIRVYHQATSEPGSPPYDCISLGSTRAQARPQHEIVPECLRWGNTPMTENMLLAGFARWGDLPNNNPGREGDLCIWDLHTLQQVKKRPSSQSVTAASFHPSLNAFATGGSAGNRVTHRKTTRTVVRTWDMRVIGFSLEFECPALDIQDLVFHPWNRDLVAVGCTDGAVYIWDSRKPDHLLHKLQHGEPISDWDNRYGESPLDREQGDVGVAMTLWGAGKNHLYTGATDGMIKLWDVNRAPEDVLIKDVTQLEAGVASAAFSPDYAYLMIGDSTGGVHLLTSGPGYHTEEEQKFGEGPIRYTPAQRNEPPAPDSEPGQGQLAAQELLSSGQLTMHPIFGVGQGPAYAGPYAAYAHETGPRSKTRLLKEIEQQQPVSRKSGRERDNAAAQNIIATFARRRYELSQNRQPDKEAPTGPTVHKPVEESSKLSKKRKRSLGSGGYLEELAKKKAKMSRAGDVASDDGQEDDHSNGHGSADEVEDYGSDTYEDDHWFPYMDLEVFEKLGINP